jgi:CRISPR system Cascade subunit CasC
MAKSEIRRRENMCSSGIKIEIHLIQNFAPSNLNRDDTGQPKSAYFGGVRRARVSSQSEKRAARNWWRERSVVPVADRTKRLQHLISNRLAEDREFAEKVADEEDRKTGVRLFTEAYYAASDKKKPDRTSVLIFISPDEVDVCARAIKEIWDKTNAGQSLASIVSKVHPFDTNRGGDMGSSDDVEGAAERPDAELAGDWADGEPAGAKRKAEVPRLKTLREIEDRIKSARVSADIALFGRMLAEQPGRNTDGACQVSHPISTHKVDIEMDFYTAVDDLNPSEETGAGMMGLVGFNSACYYRYALVDRDQLARNLARKTERINGDFAVGLSESDYGEADTVIEAFLKAMVYAIPTGKQHSFAANNLPSFGLFVRRQGGVPISLANAFCKPVRPTSDGDDLIGMSVAALTKHWDALKAVYGDQGVKTTSCFHVDLAGCLNGLRDSDHGSVERAIGAVLEATEER